MEIQRKSISCSFSTDLISEILLRVPEKSVVMFRCVSKLWLSITTDSYFIKLFETRNPRPNLLICFQEDDNLVVSSIPQHIFSLDQNSIKSYSSYSQPTHTYRMKLLEFRDYSFPTASVHGLICFRTPKTVIVWNPSTRKFLTLPQPSKSWNNITIFIGYDAVEVKYKVIATHSRINCRECRVITLGSAQESWRIVKTNQNHISYYNDAFGQCIKGVIYYLASTSRKNPRVCVIMRFEVRSEKLDSIQLPSDIHVLRLITYEGRLACVYIKDSTKENGFTLLILEDAEENKWSSKDFRAPFYHHDQSLQIKFQLNGFTHAGEFIYEPYSMFRHRESLYVLFFDPVRNSFRRVGFKGHEGHISIFPNHIESQMSL